MYPCLLRPVRRHFPLIPAGVLHPSASTPSPKPCQCTAFRRRYLQTDTDREPERRSGPSTIPIPTSVPPIRGQPRASKKKQVLSLTPRAIRRLEQLINPSDLHDLPPRLVRVGVRQKGCAGMAYDLSYVSGPEKFDEIVTSQTEDGKEVRVIIDSRALLTIIGSVMDYEESPLGSRFVFQNPNIKEQCGCGESFMV